MNREEIFDVVMALGIIQCADECVFQVDGYCNLEKCSVPNLIKNDCPYFIPKSFYKFDSLRQTSDTDNF